jgi:hypothetical protein
MPTKKVIATTRLEALDLALALLRDAKEDCKVDCGPMALSKIERAIRLLGQVRADRRHRGARVLAGKQEMRRDDSFRQVPYIPMGLSDK